MNNDELIEIVGRAADYKCTFSEVDLISLAEDYSLNSNVDAGNLAVLAVQLVKSNPQFLSFTDDKNISQLFIPKKTYIEWFVELNLKLAKAKVARLNGARLGMLMSSLGMDYSCASMLSNYIETGDELSLVKPSIISGEYVFPLARALSFHFSSSSRGCLNRAILNTQSDSPSDWKIYIGDTLSSLSQIEHQVLEMRFGLGIPSPMTLEQIGQKFELTRERIRQIEEKGLKKLRHPSRHGNLVVALLSYILRKGSLIVEETEKPEMSLILKVFGIPMSYIPLTNLLFIGLDEPSFQEIRGIRDKISNLDELAKQLNGLKGLILSSDDWIGITAQMSELSMKRRTKTEKVYLALKQIGKPSHYEAVQEAYCSLFPEENPSVHSIHALLGREELGVVWIGVRGTYALKEWGYERPSSSLLELIADIVCQRYSETLEPVPFSVLQAEVGKHRKIVNRNSVLLASYFNPRLETIGSLFIHTKTSC